MISNARPDVCARGETETISLHLNDSKSSPIINMAEGGKESGGGRR